MSKRGRRRAWAELRDLAAVIRDLLTGKLPPAPPPPAKLRDW